MSRGLGDVYKRQLLGFAPGFWGFMVNTVLFFGVSLCTKPMDETYRKEWLSPLEKHKARK